MVLVLTPMSHPSLIDPTQGIDNAIWLAEALASEPDYPSGGHPDGEEAAAHCYWQRAEHMAHSGLGAEYEYVHQKTRLPIRVTECGNSSIHNSPPPPMPEIVAEQAHDYPLIAARRALCRICWGCTSTSWVWPASRRLARLPTWCSRWPWRSAVVEIDPSYEIVLPVIVISSS